MKTFDNHNDPLKLDLMVQSYSIRQSQNGGNFLVVQSFYPSTNKSVKQLGYSLLLIFPLFGMLCLMRSMCPKELLSENSLKLTCTPRHTHLNHNHHLLLFVVFDLFSVPVY